MVERSTVGSFSAMLTVSKTEEKPKRTSSSEVPKKLCRLLFFFYEKDEKASLEQIT